MFLEALLRAERDPTAPSIEGQESDGRRHGFATLQGEREVVEGPGSCTAQLRARDGDNTGLVLQMDLARARAPLVPAFSGGLHQQCRVRLSLFPSLPGEIDGAWRGGDNVSERGARAKGVLWPMGSCRFRLD